VNGSRPSRRRRRLLWAAVIVAAVALPLIAPLFTLHRAKQRILATLSRQLGRPVSADALHLVLMPWPGFELDRVRLGDAPEFGLEDLATADDATATLRLAPLWRGRISFSSIRLQGANINIVRSAAGRWNLAELLDRAALAGPRLRPTAARAAPGAPEPFPYFELADARVNFKFGLFKRPFYLDAVNGSLTLEPSAWRVHLRCIPQRSDLRLSDTGEVTLDGVWRRPHAGQAFRDLPFDLSLHFENAYLGGLGPLLLGRDAGVHGIVAADARVQGRGGGFEISGAARGAALRRWDRLPTSLAVRVPFDFIYGAAGDSVAIKQLGDGAHWDVTGRVLNLLSRPALQLHLRLRHLDANALVPLARTLDPALPPSLSAAGEISGTASLATQPGAQPRWQGELQARGLELRGGDARVRFLNAVCQAGASLQCHARAEVPGRSSAPAQLVLTGAAGRAGLSGELRGVGLEADAAAALAELVGAKAPWPSALRGVASVAWSGALPWSVLAGWTPSCGVWQGAATWPEAAARLPALAQPLPLRNVRLARSPAGALAFTAVAVLRGEPWRLAAWRPASQPRWQFQLRARRATATAVAAALRLAPGGLFQDFFSGPPSLAPLLRRVHAQGELRVDDFVWRGRHAAVNATVDADGPAWRIAPLSVAVAGGRFSGQGEWRDGRLRIWGNAAALNLAQLLATAPAPGRDPAAAEVWADLRITTPRPLDFSRLTAAGTLQARQGPLRFSANFAWADGALHWSAPRLEAAGEKPAPPGGVLLAAAGAKALSAKARSFQAKLDRIAANADSPGPHAPVRLTAAEADDYFASPLSPLPPAISHLQLGSQGPWISGSADVDFDKLPQRSSLFTGVHHIQAQAHLDSGLAPAAQLTIEQVAIDGERIPNFLIDLAIREFIQPKHPRISRHFAVPLPAHVRSVTLGADQATLNY